MDIEGTARDRAWLETVDAREQGEPIKTTDVMERAGVGRDTARDVLRFAEDRGMFERETERSHTYEPTKTVIEVTQSVEPEDEMPPYEPYEYTPDDFVGELPETLVDIDGVGPVTVEAFEEAGIGSIDDLVDHYEENGASPPRGWSMKSSDIIRGAEFDALATIPHAQIEPDMDGGEGMSDGYEWEKYILGPHYGIGEFDVVGIGDTKAQFAHPDGTIVDVAKYDDGEFHIVIYGTDGEVQFKGARGLYDCFYADSNTGNTTTTFGKENAIMHGAGLMRDYEDDLSHRGKRRL